MSNSQTSVRHPSPSAALTLHARTPLSSAFSQVEINNTVQSLDGSDHLEAAPTQPLSRPGSVHPHVSRQLLQCDTTWLLVWFWWKHISGIFKKLETTQAGGLTESGIADLKWWMLVFFNDDYFVVSCWKFAPLCSSRSGWFQRLQHLWLCLRMEGIFVYVLIVKLVHLIYIVLVFFTHLPQ